MAEEQNEPVEKLSPADQQPDESYVEWLGRGGFRLYELEKEKKKREQENEES